MSASLPSRNAAGAEWPRSGLLPSRRKAPAARRQASRVGRRSALSAVLIRRTARPSGSTSRPAVPRDGARRRELSNRRALLRGRWTTFGGTTAGQTMASEQRFARHSCTRLGRRTSRRDELRLLHERHNHVLSRSGAHRKEFPNLHRRGRLTTHKLGNKAALRNQVRPELMADCRRIKSFTRGFHFRSRDRKTG